MRKFDAYEIHPVIEFECLDRPGEAGQFCEQYHGADFEAVKPGDLHGCDRVLRKFWTLYGHIDGEGLVEVVNDYNDKESAVEMYQLITGESYQ